MSWPARRPGTIGVMALTIDELAYFKAQLGSTVNAADLEERLIRLGTKEKAAVEALDQKVADLLAKPASFSVPGEYTEDRSANIKALTTQADAIRIRLPFGDEIVRVTNPAPRFSR